MPRPARSPLTPLAQALRAARELAGLDRQVVASTLGVAAATVAAWETGTAEPSGPRLLAYCRAVNLDPLTLPL